MQAETTENDVLQYPKQTQLEKDTMTYIAKALADKDN